MLPRAKLEEGARARGVDVAEFEKLNLDLRVGLRPI
ncbi:hypothetical protein PAE0485 [Pyrobaculum aerophilum str. IM2]|jgi:hypothetical protein|uniref:Uncharacterized protein n=1 Tax=Pyrobaculum aerophilum (strain ATCC 51768 / DSM 7523 / JCM 9630 / CIP 104966 / NBRC 100827 / IM2) TaxID=178306 RepID=Q8ZZ19_PYRAE|nr:hypothetical protein PAE0485 [Pyrobaculum aerophilum str. IM2]